MGHIGNLLHEWLLVEFGTDHNFLISFFKFEVSRVGKGLTGKKSSPTTRLDVLMYPKKYANFTWRLGQYFNVKTFYQKKSRTLVWAKLLNCTKKVPVLAIFKIEPQVWSNGLQELVIVVINHSDTITHSNIDNKFWYISFDLADYFFYFL